MLTSIGLHVNQLTTASRAQVLAVPWSVVKFMQFDPVLFAQLKQQNPSVTIVGRMYYSSQNLDVDTAMAPIRATDPNILKYIDYWETFNELAAQPGDTAGWTAISNFYANVAKALHDMGQKSCALSLGVGNPGGTDDQIKAALNILWPGVDASDAWSYHAYGAPTMSLNDLWLDLRYRKYVSLDPRYATKKLILSETGIDYGLLPNSSGGWLRHSIPSTDYASQLLAFDIEVLKDSYVLGSAIFQAGDTTSPFAVTDAGQTWGSFCVTDDLIYQIKTGLQNRSQPVPTPTPTPTPTPSDPDLAYFGMYGFTPNADSALYKYAMKELRNLYRELLAAGQVNRANLVNPGPCTSGEYTVTENGILKYRIELTNRILEVQNINGAWVPFQAEIKH